MTKLSKRPTPECSPWWSPHVHADRRPLLLARNRIKSAIRRWFEGQGFVEVEPACLQVSPGNETHLHALRTELIDTDLSRLPMYLHTSPEFALKKLLAAGERRIFTFAPVFRNRERGALHSPEFTMLEWYRARERYQTLWDDCAEVLKIAAGTTDRSGWSFRGRTCNAFGPLRSLSVDQAFATHAQIELGETYDAHRADRDALAAHAAARGMSVAADDTWSAIFSKVLTAQVEPSLGLSRPDILHSYPHHDAALARRVPASPRHAERFELYVCGVELANGFGELTDAAEQGRRFEAAMAEKERIYGERYPIDQDFLAALSLLDSTHGAGSADDVPKAAGCALGFDRLAMLATGAERIEQVQWTPLPASERPAE